MSTVNLKNPEDILGMSDEEIMNMGSTPVLEVPADSTGSAAVETPVTPEPQGKTPEETAAVNEEVPDAGGAGTAPTSEGTESRTEDGSDGVAAPQQEATPTTASTEEDKPAATAPAVEAPAINYEAEYKRILAPFRANGREVQVDSVDDAIQLMQMGANYNKRMAALKPNMKLLKMLENNDLLSEEKIGFLIDVSKKDPNAISKLVKDSGIDPMEIDETKAGAYKGNSHSVSEQEMALDAVLDEIQGSAKYNQVLDLVGNKWDAPSKQAVATAPQLLKVIHDHMASGVYDLISTEIERERMLGRLNGVHDIEAYHRVGEAINARGGFNHLFQKNPAATGAATTTAPVIVTPPATPNDTARDDKRRAAAGAPQSTPTAPSTVNPLEMSDEEFARMSVPKFR